MKGRKPIPYQVKLLEGTRGKREIREGVKFAAAPDPPDYLDTYARSVWFALAPELLAMGMLTTASREVFASYCSICSRYEFYAMAWKSPGVDADSRKVIHKAMLEAESMKARLIAEFGGTPSSAQRLAGAAQPVDELSEFLAKKEG